MSRTVDPSLSRGIARRYLDTNNSLIGPTWWRAQEGRDIVGTCRQHRCDGLMVAQPTDEDGDARWYGAECLSCGHEVTFLDRLPALSRSSRRHEMPDGAWEQREQYLIKMSNLAKGKAA